MSVFDIALEKRFTDSDELVAISVTDSDALLIRDSETGSIMRIQFSTLATAISSAFASRFASLVDGKVPASQLPSYVDDVLEYANTAAFPATGEAGKIYVAMDTNKVYRWSGSAYVEISASLALGETSSTAYRGDRGKTAYDHSQATGNPHSTSKSDVGLGNVDNTSDANKPVSTATQTALNGKPNITTANWTPVQSTIFAGPTVGGSATYSGTYTRIGDQVFVEFEINLNSSQAVSVDDRIAFGGLPVSIARDLIMAAGQAWQYNSMGSGVNAFWTVGVATTSTQMYIYCTHIDGAPTYNHTIKGRLSYKTNAA